MLPNRFQLRSASCLLPTAHPSDKTREKEGYQESEIKLLLLLKCVCCLIQNNSFIKLINSLEQAAGSYKKVSRRCVSFSSNLPFSYSLTMRNYIVFYL